MALYESMSTLDGLREMFRDPGVVFPAWVHYLAFDLMVAHYLVEKNLA